VIKAYDASRESLDLWLRYIRKNGIGGVGCRARVFEFVDYGFGRKEVESVEKQFEELGDGSAGEIEGDVHKAAEELIRKLTGEIDALEADGVTPGGAEGEGETGIEERLRDAAEHSEDVPKAKKGEKGMATATSVDEVVESEPVNKVDDEGKEIQGSAEETLETAIPEHPTPARRSKDNRPRADSEPEKKKSLADQLLEEAEEKIEVPTEGVKSKTGNQSEQKDEAKAAAADAGTSNPKV
jgi:hypothetical protein